MRIRDEYLHGSDQTGVVKKIEVTTGTGNNANKSVIKYTKADSTGGVIEVPIGDITGKAATASKLDNTSAIGSKTTPVYFTANGVPSTCTYSLNATVPVGTANQVLYYSAPNTLSVQSYATLTSNLDVFTVATSSAAGKKGLVPAPTANQLGTKNFFLRADGVWTVIESKAAAQNGTATSLVTTGEKYNWNSAYNWYNSMTSGDTDGIINKWKEVEAFLANYGDSSTLAAELAKLVTLSTDQTITGVKTFSEVINGSITGNAGTATKLKNTVTINGVTFDGSANITITANPNSHNHGNITNGGAIGTAVNKPIITTTNGVLTTGAFGTTANTFCEGNDSRLSDARKNPNALILGVLNNSGAVVGTDTLYDGSSALSFKVKAGSGITLSQNTKGEVVITNAAPDVDHNTDTKVKLTATDGTATDRYIPFPETSISSGSAQELFYQSDFKYNPGTKLFSVPNIAVEEKITVTGTSALGTVTSGVWNGTPIANDYLAHKSVTINGSIVNLGESIIVTAVANGGNAGTVGGYSPSDFLLKDEYETFESIIVSALTDLDNRKIEASDIPTSLPANGGHASTASNVDWSGVTNKPTSFPANGGNADTVGGYFPSAFVLNTKYEEFKSVVATALTDLNDRKIEASDLPTSLPANGGNADTATNVEWSGVTNKPSSFTPSSHTHTKSEITDFPISLPASDVYDWAKAETKPSYTYSEVGAAAARHTHAKSDIIDFPTSLPASDVYAWAKAETKPSYSWSEITSKPTNVSAFTNDAGYITASDSKFGNYLPLSGGTVTGNLYLTGLEEGTLDITDNTELLTSYASNNGFNDTNAKGKVYRRDAIKVYNYIKGKLDSVYSAISHTHTKSDIIDFPTSLPANGGTATYLGNSTNHLSYSNLSGVSDKTINSSTTGYVSYYYNANTISGTGLFTVDTTNSVLTSSGLLKTDTLEITNTNEAKHIAFNRSSYNYIIAPTNGSIDFICSSVVSATGVTAHITSSEISPGTTNTINLGTSDFKWKNVYATTFNGYTLAAACAKGIDTSITNSSSSVNLPTSVAVASFVEGKGYLTAHAYSYGSIDIYDINGTKKTSNNTVFATVNTETLRLQEGANIAITAINSGTSGGDSIKIAVTGITSNIDRNGYGQLALWHNGASSASAILQSVTYNEKLTVKAGSGIDFSETDSTANNDIWTISAIPYNCAITLNNNSVKSLIKDSWSADAQSVYLTSNGTSSGTSLAAGTYALWIEDRASASGTPNYYSGTFTCAGSATAGRLDEIALHSSMATSADTNAPTRIFVATQISGTSGKHVLRFCSQDSSTTNHYLTVKVNRII